MVLGNKEFTKGLGEKYKLNLKILDSTEEFLDKMEKDVVCAELGVFKGENAVRIIKNSNPKELHLIDVYWKEHGEYYPDWGEYTYYGKLKTRDAYNLAQDNVKEVDEKNVTTFHVGKSEEVLEEFEDSYFDWIYLDTTHLYGETVIELEIIKNKVKDGGIIAGHDYCKEYGGVIRAVNEFCIKYNYELIFLTNEEYPSWAIKEMK
ncbi:class I SAM-dependent methyltransferase [archaeon]|jgi:hypothetical protein|nr:class I SAM-dependent methyltransferase [archaeon]